MNDHHPGDLPSAPSKSAQPCATSTGPRTPPGKAISGDIEQALIDEICFNYWRLQQVREVELQTILEHSTDFRIIALYLRYRAGYEHAFYKALDKLHRMQRIRKQTAKAETLRSAKKPDAADSLRSADAESSRAGALAAQLEDHLLENQVRELALPPLETPESLMNQLNKFVSQNPAVVPDRLLEPMRKAA